MRCGRPCTWTARSPRSTCSSCGGWPRWTWGAPSSRRAPCGEPSGPPCRPRLSWAPAPRGGEAIRAALPATAELAAAALVIALAIAIPLGTLAAVKRNTLLDRGAMFLALLGVSLPNFVLAPLLVLVFAIALALLPVSGREGLATLVLPAFILG